MPPKTTISVLQLREWLNYDREKGVLIWKKRPCQSVKVNDVAGSVDGNGYMRVKVLGVRVQVHRAVWAIENGDWPKLGIDHKDCNKKNNKIENLREATVTQNIANRPANRLNSLGVKGVFLNKRKNKFQSQISICGKKRHLGYFESVDAAAGAYVKAAILIHGNYAHAGNVL